MLAYLTKHLKVILSWAAVLIVSLGTVFALNGIDSYTIKSGDAVVLSFPKKVESISFSKSSGFTIRTLEWGQWIDMSDQVSDYYPLRGYLIRNSSAGDLIISVDYAMIDSIEDTLLQKDLPAGWNLVGVASKIDDQGTHKVSVSSALGDSLPYSQVIDFTGQDFPTQLISNEANPFGRIDETNYAIKTKAQLAGLGLYERIAYGIFVNVDSVISGTQNLESPSVDPDLLRTITSLEAANELASFWVIPDSSLNPVDYRLTDNISREEAAEVTSKLWPLTINGAASIYQDTDFGAWFEQYVKALNEAWVIPSTTLFFPKNNLTKVDALRFVMWVRDIDFADGGFDENVVNDAVSAWLAIRFQDFDTQITRGQFFIWAADAVYKNDQDDDILNDLLNWLHEANVVNVPLSNISATKWSIQTKVFEFDIEAGEGDTVLVDDVSIQITDASIDGFASSQEIFDVSLYQDAISPSNLIETIPWSGITGSGVVYFDSSVDPIISQNDTKRFIVTMTFTNNQQAIDNSNYRVVLTDIFTTDNGDEISETGLPIQWPAVTITDTGKIAGLEFDASNADNENDKTALGNDDVVIASYDIQAQNEDVNVGSVSFSLTGAFNIANSISDAQLLLDGNVVANVWWASISDTDIIFSFSNLVIPQINSEIGLRLTVANNPDAQTGIRVADVSLSNAQWVNSGVALVTADIVDYNGVLSRALDITAPEPGNIISLHLNGANIENEDPKLILAGTSSDVVSYSIAWENEAVDISSLTFSVAGASGLANSVVNGVLLLDWVVVALNTNWGITDSTIAFTGINDLIIPDSGISKLTLRLNTQNIGQSQAWVTQEGIQITGLAINSALWVSSGQALLAWDIASQTWGGSQTFGIAPGVISPSVATSLNASATPEISLNLNTGSNTNDADNTAPTANIDQLMFSTLGSSVGPVYILHNVDDATQTATGSLNGSDLTFNLSSLGVANTTLSTSASETFRISILATNPDDTISLRLLETGVLYSMPGVANANSITLQSPNQLDLGSRTY